MTAKSNGKAYLALGVLCIVWGTTYLVLRIGVTQFPAFLFSMIRFLIAGPLLAGLVILSGRAGWPSWQTIKTQAIIGFFPITIGISVVGWGEVVVSSSVAAILCSLMPIWVLLINLVINRKERPTPVIVTGLVVGLAGVLLIFSEHLVEFTHGEYLTGIVAILLANGCWAIGSILTKKAGHQSDPFLNAGLQMFFGGLYLIPISLVFDDYSQIAWNTDIVMALAYMILVGSVAAYACYFYAINQLPMTLVSLYAYVNPAIAFLLGWIILDEKMSVGIFAGMMVVLAGIFIVNRGTTLTEFWNSRVSRNTSR
ncbi:MAG: EamA family transporter [Cyclobacteriaceae bacterium]|nr:EamA family transporter [Cyclobacteriaceae bacterium]